ncbi:MAG: hypothetical protein FJW27_16890 [Acidimicrobiia bacterium]|nr:hypothetical protein [Acidimicrobiia bacterium]
MSDFLQPMLAALDDAPLADPRLVYEPKYDGIRTIAEVHPGSAVRLWSRLGNEKTAQFPEVAAALAAWGRRLPDTVILDGELVALDAQGRPTGFQQLQGRIHVAAGANEPRASVAFIVFDVLRAAGHDLRECTLLERRSVLERLMRKATKAKSVVLRLSEQVRGDGRALYERALKSGWEGLIAKHVDSRYRSGKRTPEWRKLKILHEQEFVIGGWTEPRHARTYFGALLLGVYEDDALVYVGHVGTGFDKRELARVMVLLQRREVSVCPFTDRPKTNDRPHWIKPDLVAQIKFTEWTADAKLRHPVYLGLRDDKSAREVRREAGGRLHASTRARLPEAEAFHRARRPDAAGRASATRVTGGGSRPRGATANAGARRERTHERPADGSPSAEEITALVRAFEHLEGARQDATLDLGGGRSIAVTNLHKPFWPSLKLTKGDLFRFYVQVAPVLLPAIADRPLVMKRYPNGVDAKPFYQHRATNVPPCVRTETVREPSTGGGTKPADASRTHVIGGDLLTVLYTTQLAAISQDPWFSRVQSLGDADFVALDLDPSSGVRFRQVLDVARAIHDELESIGAVGVPKTSGSSGLHIYVPLPPSTPYEAGLLFCQIIATVVAHKHPKIATVERTVSARGRRVYVDFLQNVMGKTLASAYSARASEYAGVSTPLTWAEIEAGVDREDFTIRTVPARLAKVGDLWAALRKAKGVDLTRAAKYGR